MPRKNPEAIKATQAAYQKRYQEAHAEELRQKKAQYRLENKEKIRQQKAASYQRNKESIAAKQKEKLANRTEEEKEYARLYGVEYYGEHRQEFLEYQRIYTETHKEEITAYHAKRYQREKEETKARLKEWRKTHPEERKVHDHRRRARKQNLPGTWTAKEQEFMRLYWHDSCAVCGNQRGLFWTLAHDHWIPLASSHCPGTVATNMLPLCHGEGGCNNSKNKTEPHVWLVRRYGTKKAAVIEKRIATYFALVSTTFPKEPLP